VSQLRHPPSFCHQQHPGDDGFNLNGLLANVSSRGSKEKMHINVVVIGHVDSGKSTTTGKHEKIRHRSREQRAHKT